MQRVMRHLVIAGLLIGAQVTLGAARTEAGDWGFRMIGDLGGAPASAADPFFNADKRNFSYDSRGLELGVAWRSWDAGVFVSTVRNGYLERGYKESACGVWPDGFQVCQQAGGPPIREGTRVNASGMRLIGIKGGGFLTVYRPAKWVRFGVPLHAGLAFYTGSATKETWTREVEVTAAGTFHHQRCSSKGSPGQCVPDKVDGDQVFARGGPPYFLVSGGFGVKIRTASWAEFEICLKAENPRLPVVSWGMTFRKHKD